MEEDSNEHTMIDCQVSRNLWSNVENWINEIGVVEYYLTNKIKYWVN